MTEPADALPAAPPHAPTMPATLWAERSLATFPDGIVRCAWGVENDALYRAYHDAEWGRPNRDGRHLLEMLVLEGAQAGLSWSTILRKREGYRAAFADFDPERMAAFDERDVARLLADPGIVRNRLKVESAIANARATLALGGTDALSDLLWGFVGGVPLDSRPVTFAAVAPETEESRTMSRELKRLGFRFVGPTVCYAFMQACGMVNDHMVGCAFGDEIRAA